jgi:FMN reductase [NAD(P)H]
MNPTIEVLKNHRSDRSFTDQPVDEADLAAIIESAHRAPTAMNAQHVSLVITRDAAARARISAIANGQPWIARAPVFVTIVLDFHKTGAALAKHGRTQAVQDSLEGLIAGVTDVGIVLGTMIAAAHALGLGIVPIGSIRNKPQEMVDLLGLPACCLPVVGLCVGHAAKAAPLKPRLALSTFRHDERYSDAGLSEAIDAYDRTLIEHLQKAGRKDVPAWSQSIANAYDHDPRPEVKAAAAAQGFRLD